MLIEIVDMDARGNKLSSCKIPDQYLEKQNSYWTFRTLATLAEQKWKMAKKRETMLIFLDADP